MKTKTKIVTNALVTMLLYFLFNQSIFICAQNKKCEFARPEWNAISDTIKIIENRIDQLETKISIDAKVDINAYIDLIKLYAKSRQYEQILDCASKALELSENITSAQMSALYFYRALSSYHVGRSEDAMNYINESIKRNAYNSDSYYVKALVYISKNDLIRAEDNLRKAISINSENIDALCALSKLLFSLDNYGAALSYAKLAIDIDQRSISARISRERCYERLGSYDKALTDVLELITLTGGSEGAINILISLYHANPMLVKEHIEDQLKKDSNDLVWLYCNSRLNEKFGDIEYSINSYKRLYDCTRNPVFLERIAHCYSLKLDFVSAHKYIDKSILIDTSNAAMITKKAMFYWYDHQYNSAAYLCDEALKINHNAIPAKLLKTKISLLSDNIDDAFSNITQIIQHDNTVLDAYLLRGFINAILGNEHQSKLDLISCIEYANEIGNNALSPIALSYLGDKKSALNVAETLTKAKPYDPESLYVQASTHAIVNNQSEALAILKEIYSMGYNELYLRLTSDLNFIQMTEFEEYNNFLVNISKNYSRISASEIIDAQITNKQEQNDNSYRHIASIAYTEKLGIKKIRCSLNDMPVVTSYVPRTYLNISSFYAERLLYEGIISDKDIISNDKHTNKNIPEGSTVIIKSFVIGNLHFKNIRSRVVSNNNMAITIGDRLLGKKVIDTGKQIHVYNY